MRILKAGRQRTSWKVRCRVCRARLEVVQKDLYKTSGNEWACFTCPEPACQSENQMPLDYVSQAIKNELRYHHECT